MHVLVTGANGFVGQALCRHLTSRGWRVRAAVRRMDSRTIEAVEKVEIGELDLNTRWDDALAGVQAVVHLAGKAHSDISRGSSSESELYFKTNVDGTVGLLAAARRRGIERFVYLSSVKVNGENSERGPFRASDIPAPQDIYGKSKCLAEQAVRQAHRDFVDRTVIIRAPLLYGAGVRANYLRLMQWVFQGRPLPFRSIRNQRSLLYVENLCDLMTTVLTKSEALGGIWMASDGQDLSTAELVKLMGASLGKPARLWAIPASVLRMAGLISGKSGQVSRLIGSLTVDMTATTTALSWTPPWTPRQGIDATVSWFLRGSGEQHQGHK